MFLVPIGALYLLLDEYESRKNHFWLRFNSWEYWSNLVFTYMTSFLKIFYISAGNLRLALIFDPSSFAAILKRKEDQIAEKLEDAKKPRKFHFNSQQLGTFRFHVRFCQRNQRRPWKQLQKSSRNFHVKIGFSFQLEGSCKLK